MAENSKIEWTTHTWNPWRGCTKISEGCANCYADAQAKRNPGVLGIWGPNGSRVVASEAMWRQPLKWNEQAEKSRAIWEFAATTCKSEYDNPGPYERPRVFCASMADVFEDWQGPMVDAKGDRLWHLYPPSGTWMAKVDGYADKRPVTMSDVRARLLRLIDATPNLDWLLLTKRPENIRKMLPPLVLNDPVRHDEIRFGVIPNLWLMTSVESADQLHRIDTLKACRSLALILGLSIEPLLGPMQTLGEYLDGIDWVIVGGESGRHARPCHPDWARSIRDQCQTAGVAFFFKQWGEYGPSPDAGLPDHLPDSAGYYFDGPHPPGKVWRFGKKAAGRLLDGREWNEFPKGESQA